VFDYLFGTAKKIPHDQLAHMEIGLEYFRDPRETGLVKLLLMPFTWRRAERDRPGHVAGTT